MKRTSLLLWMICMVISAFLVLLLGNAAGMPPPSRERLDLRPIPVMRVGLDVLVNGRRVPIIHHRGKNYLAVPKLGTEYQIRVWNHGPRRITAVVSVDGLSVINGRVASEHHPGYIVAPRRSVAIKGWRRDHNIVRAFRFVEREESYAAKLGHPENIGVIGLVAFEEMSRIPRPLPLEPRAGAARAERNAFGPVGNTGTGAGRDVQSPVVEVPFVRSNRKRTVTIYYDTAEALRRAGVPVDRHYPEPFPGGIKIAN